MVREWREEDEPLGVPDRWTLGDCLVGLGVGILLLLLMGF